MNPQPNRAQQLQLRAFLKEFTRPHNRPLLLSIFLGFSSGVLMIISCYVLAQLCHKVMFAGQDLTEQTQALYLLAGLGLLRALLIGASRAMAERSALNIKLAMREALWKALVKQQENGSANRPASEWVLTLNQGVEALHDYFAKYLPAVAYAGLIPFAIIAVVFPIDWKSGLIFLITAPLIPFFMILIGSKAQALNERNWQSLQYMGQFFFDRLNGLTQLKLFNSAQSQVKRVEQMADQFRISTLSVLRIAFISTLALEFLATISIALVAVIIGFRLYFGTLDFATGFVVLLLAPEFYLPLRQLGQHYHAKLKGLASADSMLALLSTQELQQAPLPKNTRNKAKLESITKLEVQDLSLRLDEGANAVLKNISFSTEANGILALVGQSGAGKSTLMDCLMGLYPQANSAIRINGIPLTDIDIASYQQRIAWVAQTPTLFSGSLAENIALGSESINLEAIRALCKELDLDAFIMALPHQYDTKIGELGQGLSGGQIQRLALARALLRRPDMIFLDEPTAALDKLSEQKVQACLERISQNTQVVIIAHRLNTLSQANQVLVLKQGELIEQGSYSELAADTHSQLGSMLKAPEVVYG
ncbi:thiol reductant ABC exporter subunit CydD [Pseudoalteromonas sp. T1lg10]|uniref:thiol reductant ABC exporter subunit CydD n=1 Tax=Pseudoalteromonas sp. T1lg10 TaxID=2077093 RepID=UPI000CF65246|nr:thiol reductant ABC exporter subunit CydD [Pseudoalteromonas sp. T1lg10]